MLIGSKFIKISVDLKYKEVNIYTDTVYIKKGMSLQSSYIKYETIAVWLPYIDMLNNYYFLTAEFNEWLK